mgnify:CR=1 FL=1
MLKTIIENIKEDPIGSIIDIILLISIGYIGIGYIIYVY